MATKKPLRWKSRRAAAERTPQIRLLSLEFTPQNMSAPLPGTAATATIDLPDLTSYPAPIDKAIRLLQAGAAIEHALLIQYLYAGYGFSPENRDILNIAIEEMSHLMTVQNLLLLVGAQPDLSRQDFGTPDGDEERLFPFDLMLEPVTHESLAKYVVAESPKDSPTGVDPQLMDRIVQNALQGSGASINRVGTLYALLGAVFGSEQLLLQKAATGDAWYVMVNALAAEAALEYGGRDRLHLPDIAFVPAPMVHQGTDREWDRSVVNAGLDEFRVHVSSSREQALEALRDIGLQGEGPSTAATELAHFIRFLNLYKQFYGPDGTGTGPAPHAAAVPSAAKIFIDEQSADPQVISHPETARWARLANHRYGILLGTLEMYLRLPAPDRQFLLGWCFAEMFALKKLSNYLTKKPRTSQVGPNVGAVPFTLPAWTGHAVTWDDLEGEFSAAAAEVAAIQAGPGNSDDQKRVLGHLASSDLHKLAEVQARKLAGTVRRKVDRAREILDWAAGAGDPRHLGDSPEYLDQDQGRFWNLALADLKQVSIAGTNIWNPPGPGQDAPLIRMLRLGFMPRNRPPLATTDPEFMFLEDWVRNQCPDEPA